MGKSTGKIKKLGINGFGRIGKLTVWNQIGLKYFEELVINVGREVGVSINDIAHYIERDSTYGSLQSFLYGFKSKPVVKEIDEQNGTMIIDGIKVTFLRNNRNPADIEWKENGVEVVVDTTGQFLDPTIDGDDPKGSVRGHLKAGAKKVIVSAPFKIKDKSKDMPEDSVTTVMGINGDDYDSEKHILISNASCTTTCLAHMIKPLLDEFSVKKIMSASMVTVHAATGSQKILDSLVKKGKTDLRKNRSILNNIILTTTGAAKTLGLVIPEMNKIGFITESIRIPTNTGSLIIVTVNINSETNREAINKIFEDGSLKDKNNYLLYSEKQNVSSDIIGNPSAAAIIESTETQCRTSLVNDNSPVTQAVIYGWYDNELGSYTNMLTDRITSIVNKM